MNENDIHLDDFEDDQHKSSPEEIEAFIKRNQEFHEQLKRERIESDERNRKNPRYAFGQWMRDWRLENPITLRELGKRFDIDIVNYGKLESGILAPPINDPKVIHRLASDVFGLEHGSEKYSMFWALAKDAHAAIVDEMSKEYVPDPGVFPMFPVTESGGKLNAEALDHLANTVSEHYRPTDIGNIFNDQVIS